jgi:hypothetical protein
MVYQVVSQMILSCFSILRSIPMKTHNFPQHPSAEQRFRCPPPLRVCLVTNSQAVPPPLSFFAAGGLPTEPAKIHRMLYIYHVSKYYNTCGMQNYHNRDNVEVSIDSLPVVHFLSFPRVRVQT